MRHKTMLALVMQVIIVEQSLTDRPVCIGT